MMKMKKCITGCDFQFHPFDDEEKGVSKSSSIHCIRVHVMSLCYDVYIVVKDVMNIMLILMFKLLVGRQWRRTGEPKLPKRNKMR